MLTFVLLAIIVAAFAFFGGTTSAQAQQTSQAQPAAASPAVPPVTSLSALPVQGVLPATGAVENAAKPDSSLALNPNAAPTPTPVTSSKSDEALSERERLLLERVEQLERRLANIEARTDRLNASSGFVNTSEKNVTASTTAGNSIASGTPSSSPVSTTASTPGSTTASNSTALLNGVDQDPPNNSNPQNQGQIPDNTGRVGAADPRQVSDDDRQILDFFKRTTVNLTVDGYYGYNFNRPVGGINLLRAYDVQSNSFSLNQAAFIVERAPDVEAGQRFGVRLDLQYGQATESGQGNPGSEPRPQVYRNVWQAYGTYVAPIGNGLVVDFGKFAGSLGYETNYSKDNINYTRSFFFNFLPFYHAGFRTTYSPNDKVTLQNWIVNGTNQTEDFNGFKSTAFLLTYKPTARVSTQFNYYVGQEQRDRNPALNPGFALVPSQPGLSLDVIRPVPGGRLHVFDAYSTFNVTDKLTLALQGDYVINRASRDSSPARVVGGVGYARYQFTERFAGAGRFEYMSDRGGLFSGVTQALKEGTLTAEYKFADGFLGRAEYRRDYSNQPFFLTEQPGILKREQNTATLGLVFWIGRKQGTW